MKVKIKKEEIESAKQILGIACIFCLNSICYRSTIVSILVGIIEVGVTVYCLLSRKLEDFLLCFLLMACSAIENPIFAFGDSTFTFYSFLKLPYINSYHVYLLIFLAIVKNASYLPIIWRDKSKMATLVKLFIVLFLSQIIMFLVTIFLNDNNINYLSGILNYSIRDAFYLFMTVGMLVISCICLEKNNRFVERLKKFILSFFIGMIISVAFLITIHNYYYTQENTTIILTCSLCFFITNTIIILFFQEDKPYLFLFLGIVTILIQRSYTLGIAGTWWVMIACTLILFIICAIPKPLTKKNIVRFFLIVFGALIILKLTKVEDLGQSINNYQVSYKLESFKNILDLGTDINSWYTGLGDSIQTRIEEIVNIFIEYKLKPGYALLGKGFGGTIHKYWGISDWNMQGATFSNAEIWYKTYSTLHTGIAEIFINSGFFGIGVYVWIIIMAIKQALNKKRNCWIYIGMWGVLFLHNFNSLCLATVILCYGFYLIDCRKAEDYEGKKK